MKRFLIFTMLIMSFLACDNEIDLNENWKEIPVTYAIFNPVDSAQYIRLEKAFLDPNSSALEIAKIADSLYFKDVEVYVQNIKNNNLYTFELIDANKDGYKRDTGVFATSPNYLYKSKDFHPTPANKYKFFVLKSQAKDTLASATIDIVDNIEMIRPHTNNYVVNLRYINNFNIIWRGGDEKGYYDVNIYFRILEKNINNDTGWQERVLKWKAGTEITETSYQIIGKRFFTFLQDNLEKDINVRRKFLNFDLEVVSVGRELKEYIDILHSGGGITTSLQLPTYTNLSNGYGVVSSVNSVSIPEFLIGQIMRDSLEKGIYTKDLNFE